ncbi:hypothetical protein [Rhizobium sp.]|uniref:hypothetical protein n=1 Tax=Rhizobium sp. TaxID=391 RepID=UPI0028AD3FE5
MRRHYELKSGKPLIPTSAYLALVTVMIAMASAAVFISSTKETQRTRVYLADEWQSADPSQLVVMVRAQARPRENVARDRAKYRQIATNTVPFD